MKRAGFVALSGAALLLSAPVTAKGLRVSPSIAIDRLRTERSNIASLRVTHVDDLTSTQIPITPAALATWPDAFRHRTSDEAVIEEAVRLVGRSAPLAVREADEVRWELAFVDRSGMPLLTVFHDSWDLYGYVGETAVRFGDDALLGFLRSHFGVHEKTLDRL